MIKVHLHGHLSIADKQPIELEVSTGYEVLELLSLQIETFKPDPKTGRKRVQIAGFETLEDYHKPLPENAELHILPELFFGKEDGALETIVGIVLIIVAVYFQQYGLASSIAEGMIAAGIGLAIGGIIRMLSPQPDLNEGSENGDTKRSLYLGSPINTIRAGTPIALLYGTRKWGGHILSGNFDAKGF